jgi:hypothetical protein
MLYPSIPFYYRPIIWIDPNSLEKSIELNQEYIEIVKIMIDQVIDVFMKKKLLYEPFIMRAEKDSKSGITNKSGFYLIFNIKEKGLYLGETRNFATRKATYMRDMREAIKHGTDETAILPSSFQKQLAKSTIIKQVLLKQATVTDFIFVPVVISDSYQFRCTLKKEQVAKSESIDQFLIHIETMILTQLMKKN